MKSENKEKIIPIAIDKEMSNSYLTYAMSVIISRALPDVRDGLKPVHRRILYSMQEMGLQHTRSLKKSGRIVGDVLGKYHPHGDQSIYEALVRMAQNFSLRYPLIRGQGNFGSVDGDPPAAMRYTEAKLEAISEELLRDIKKQTVDFKANYDDSLKEPSVLPSALPFLLLNGASGIAVGMATQIPPHNLSEVVEALLFYLDHPESTVVELMNYIKGPDFPTQGIICGRMGILQAYKTGRGQIIMRGRHHIEKMASQGRERIVFTEIPYQVNKANLLIKISDLIKDRVLEGISDLRDESNRDGIRIVIELKKSFDSTVILESLYNSCDLQKAFNVNAVALVEGSPKQLTLVDFLNEFLKFRKQTILRRTKFDLERAKSREHILLGLKIAITHIDEIVEMIKRANNPLEAKQSLITNYRLTDSQAQAILEMRLQRLTGLEIQKIHNELKELEMFISECQEILSNEAKMLSVIRNELKNILERFGDKRLTEIQEEEVSTIDMDDLVQRAEMVILLSSAGYIKRVPLTEYRSQGRGGKGLNSAVREDDSVFRMLTANTHDYAFFVTNLGNAYCQKVYTLAEGTRSSKGKHVKGFLNLEDGEEIRSIVTFSDFKVDEFILVATQKGQVVRIATEAFKNAKSRGIKTIDIAKGDSVVGASWTNGKSQLIGITAMGQGVRFSEQEVRETGRGVKGVRAMKLKEKDSLLSVVALSHNEKEVVVISEKGFAKRLKADDISVFKRGASGVICYSNSEESLKVTGRLVSALALTSEVDVICVTAHGKTIKTPSDEIALQGRMARGVKVISLESGDKIVSCACAEAEED